MSDLNSFLAEESSGPTLTEQTDLTPETGAPEDLEPETETEQPAQPTEQDQPPAGLDKRAEAIWREERTRRKELQAQVDKMNARWEQMVERMQAGQTQQPEQPAEIEIPDFDDDPIGHLRAKNELLERQLQEVNQERSQTRAQREQVQQFQQLQSGVDAMETQFAQANPDYNDAVGYLYENVGRMATAMGYNPQQVQQVISQTAMDISVRALQGGRNPAEAAYEAARAMGWTNTPQPQGADEGEPEVPRRKPPTSLSGLAGKRTAAGALSWDAISQMDDKEFDAIWAQMEKSARNGR